jgi:hypothetical protein
MKIGRKLPPLALIMINPNGINVPINRATVVNNKTSLFGLLRLFPVLLAAAAAAMTPPIHAIRGSLQKELFC